ncbi:MAG: asparagine synthase-related protein, partial [Solirubrobacteraceae bacterium]
PKRGFEVPVARWFRTDLRDYAHDTLLDPAARSRQWCSEGAVRTLLNQHVAGVQDHGRQIWTLLMLELWSQPSAHDRSDALQCSLQSR